MIHQEITGVDRKVTQAARAQQECQGKTNTSTMVASSSGLRQCDCEPSRIPRLTTQNNQESAVVPTANTCQFIR